MVVLWDRSPLTSAEVVEKLAGQRSWNPRTIKTLLNRLVTKRAVAFAAQGKRYLYRPSVSREACVRQESRSFLSRVFRGSTGPMLVQFVQHAELTEADVEALRKVLQEKSKIRGGRR